MKKVTLQLSDGRKLVFSGVENISISEETTMKSPQEGEWFAVNPLEIDQNLFKEQRSDSRQEETRQLILEAFEQVKEKPKYYARPFKTMMPEKTWPVKTVGELKAMAEKLGDHNADWVEQALEWAQRIVNGKSWESICNEPDTANYYRFVVWKNGYCRTIGGMSKNNSNSPASVDSYNSCDNETCLYTVPLIVRYD